MKKIKLIFIIAAVVFSGFVICLISLIHSQNTETPSEPVLQVYDSPVVKADSPEDAESEDTELTKEAKSEIRRFKEDYGIDISMDEMMKQLKIRREQEDMYNNSYELEDVFMVSHPEDNQEGDEGADDIYDMLSQIERYIEKYAVNESEYESMNIEEELAALKEKYGELPDAVDDVSGTKDPEDYEESGQ